MPGRPKRKEHPPVDWDAANEKISSRLADPTDIDLELRQGIVAAMNDPRTHQIAQEERAVRWAKKGDLHPLAELIEKSDEPLGREARKLVASVLRGSHKVGRRRIARAADEEERHWAVKDVQKLAKRKGISLEEAIRRLQPEHKRRLVSDWVKRAPR